MKTAIRVAVTMALRLKPLGTSQDRLGVIEPSGAPPVYTLSSAITENTMRTSTSMPSRAYCNRADTSMPR